MIGILNQPALRGGAAFAEQRVHFVLRIELRPDLVRRPRSPEPTVRSMIRPPMRKAGETSFSAVSAPSGRRSRRDRPSRRRPCGRDAAAGCSASRSYSPAQSWDERGCCDDERAADDGRRFAREGDQDVRLVFGGPTGRLVERSDQRSRNDHPTRCDDRAGQCRP